MYVLQMCYTTFKNKYFTINIDLCDCTFPMLPCDEFVAYQLLEDLVTSSMSEVGDGGNQV